MHNIFHFTLLSALIAATCGIYPAPPAHAAIAEISESKRKQFSTAPVFLEADKMDYDQKAKIVRAKGNVEVVQGERILRARTLTYNESTNTVEAAGDVVLLEPDGNVMFADEVVLRDDLKTGVVTALRARMVDNSLFAATEASRPDDNTTEFKNAVYSPCKVCTNEEGETEDPLWQIKARRIVHDKEEQRISYNHAWFEVYGMPVAYTPYFSHIAPGADRKSGILSPEYRASSLLGTVVEVPYYANIADNMDATITPVYTSKEGMAAKGEFRHLTKMGMYEVKGSYTRPGKRDEFGQQLEGDEMRGHIEARGNFRVNNTWNWGFDAMRASDKTYLRRYDISNEDTLTSRLYMEGIGGPNHPRTYALVEGLSFQGLNPEDDEDSTPLILPMMQFQHATSRGWMGSWFNVTGNTLSLTRESGSQMQRLSLDGSWNLPFVAPGGHVFTFATALRSDVFNANNIVSETGREFDESSARIIPEASLEWRYPLAGELGSYPVIVEPIAQIIASPNGGNPDDIPNIDSQVVEFADSNLFSDNRYAGLDRVENGVRGNYGIRSTVELRHDRHLEAMFGQSYHEQTDDNFPFARDLTSHHSDYVGKVSVEDNRLFAQYRFRLDEDNARLRSSAVTGLVRFHPVYMNVDYIALDDDPNLGDLEEVFAGASWVVDDNWTLSAGGRRDLQRDDMIDARAGVTYYNECITVMTQVGREFTRFRDLEPSTTVMLKVSLRNVN